MKTLTTLLVGIAIGAFGMAVAAAVPVGPADDATKAAVQNVKRGIVAGHKAKDRAALDRLYADDYTAIDSKGAIRSKRDLLNALPTDAEIADGSSRVSNYYSFNVFEQRDGRWVYSAAFLP